MPLTFIYLYCINIMCTYSTSKLPYSPARNITGEYCSSRAMCKCKLGRQPQKFMSISAPWGVSGALAPGSGQSSYYWNGSLTPAFQRGNPLQAPLPQSRPQQRVRLQAGKLIKIIAAEREWKLKTCTCSNNFPLKVSFKKKNNKKLDTA